MTQRLQPMALALALATALVPHAAQAADRDKVDKLLVLLRPERQLQQVEELTMQALDRRIDADAMRNGVSPDEAARVKAQVMPRIRKLFDDTFSTEYIRQMSARIYTEELTNDEVDAAIAYYGSPAGQSLAAKLPSLMKRGSEAGMMRAREMEPQIDAIMKDAATRMREAQRRDSAARVGNAVKQVQDAEAKDAVAPAASAASDAGSGAHDGSVTPAKP